MIKRCIVDGKPFEAKRPQAKYCGQTCRKRAQRGTVTRWQDDSGTIGPIPGLSGVTSPGQDPNSPNIDANSLVRATAKQLENAGVLDTMLGQQALRIATQMSGFETAGGMAALSKELSRVMSEALRAAAVIAVDEVDELKAKREAKLKAAG